MNLNNELYYKGDNVFIKLDIGSQEGDDESFGRIIKIFKKVDTAVIKI